MPALDLAEVRSAAAAALAPAPAGVEVIGEVVDQLEPPAVLLLWDDPWLVPSTLGPGLWTANFSVLCLAGRLEPGPGVDTLEGLVGFVVNSLKADTAHSWPAATSQAPRVFEIGGLPYLGARLTYELPVSIENGGP